MLTVGRWSLFAPRIYQRGDCHSSLVTNRPSRHYRNPGRVVSLSTSYNPQPSIECLTRSPKTYVASFKSLRSEISVRSLAPERRGALDVAARKSSDWKISSSLMIALGSSMMFYFNSE